MIKVVIYPGGRIASYTPKGRRISVGRLLQALSYEAYAAVVVKNGTPLTEDDLIYDGDEVEIYEVTSTG